MWIGMGQVKNLYRVVIICRTFPPHVWEGIWFKMFCITFMSKVTFILRTLPFPGDWVGIGDINLSEQLFDSWQNPHSLWDVVGTGKKFL